MQNLGYNENKQRGTIDFPFEFYHITQQFPRYIMNYHWHLEYEIIRILKGEFHVTLDEKNVIAQEGDILFINSGILHSGIPYACVYECLVFDMNIFLKQNPTCIPFIQDIVDQQILIFHHFSGNKFPVHDCIWHVFDAMREKKPGYELIVFGELLHFFGLIHTEHLYHKDPPQTRRDFKRILQLKKVLEFMETSYASPITLEELSCRANMSSKYFCRFFAEMTHQRPMDYLNRYRIEQASSRLLTTDESVTDIAYNCGFNDLSYFIKTFKKYKGVTPGRYMRRAR